MIRTIKQAQAEAARRWGKTAAVRLNPVAATPDERKQLAAMTKEQVDAMTREQRRERTGALLSRRCTVGRIELGMFLSVRGQGDSWDEAFTKASESDARGKAWYAECRKRME